MNKYSTTYTYPQSPRLLPNWQDSSQWSGTDTEQLYKTNMERQPPGWIWANKPVHYTWNREGYRSVDFGDIDWPRTHAVLGCSYVSGVGVDDADTLPSQLAQQLGEPTVNLGYGGGSCQTIMYNTMRMIELGWLPKTVTIVIPDLARMTYFNDNDPMHFMPFILNQANHPTGILKFYEYWLRPPNNAEIFSRMSILGAEAMWINKNVPVILRHWHHDPKEGSQMAPYLSAVQDKARDFSPTPDKVGWHAHPGPLTLGLWARDIADAIRSL